MSLQYIRGSEDPDAALFRQMGQYVLDHYPNPTRTGCPDSQTLKLLVCEPLTLDSRDANSCMSWNVQSVCAKSLHSARPAWQKQARRQLLWAPLYRIHQLGPLRPHHGPR